MVHHLFSIDLGPAINSRLQRASERFLTNGRTHAKGRESPRQPCRDDPGADINPRPIPHMDRHRHGNADAHTNSHTDADGHPLAPP